MILAYPPLNEYENYYDSYLNIEMLSEAIEGEALDDVKVIGVVTFFIHRTKEDDRPV